MENTEKLGEKVDYLYPALLELRYRVAEELERLEGEIKFLKLTLGISALANVGWALLFGWLAWGGK